jgi:hypothetical protein
MENKKRLLNEMLGKLGVDVTAFSLKKGNSIWCFIICTNAQQLKQLYKHYQSGLMKKVLEEVFVLLADRKERQLIRRLTWDLEDFTEKRRRLKRLKDLGKSSEMRCCINDGNSAKD